MHDQGTAEFLRHRKLLFAVAYEMLGSAVDAEDAVQETWIKWAGAKRDDVKDPRSYLVRIASREALARLRVVARRRESYVGPWLPEPVPTSAGILDGVVAADDVRLAMLMVLETLTPTQRAVFVLRDVFDVSYAEIAAAVDREEPAVRQIAHRARRHVEERRPRHRPSPEEIDRVLNGFQHGLRTGELQPLLDVLAPEVVVLSDGGGKVQALPRPVSGAAAVAKLLTAGVSFLHGRAELRRVEVNSVPALLVVVDGEVDGLVAVDIEGGRLVRLFYVRNPDKLGELTRVLSGRMESATSGR